MDFRWKEPPVCSCAAGLSAPKLGLTPRTSGQMARPAGGAASLAGSFLERLDARGSLRLVTDAVPEDDTLALALCCRPLRDAIHARFPLRLAGPLAGTRFRTQDVAVAAVMDRLLLRQPLSTFPVPAWLAGWPARVSAGVQVARAGQLRVLQWMQAHGCPLNAQMCLAAAEAGQLPVLRWLRANNCEWDAGICEAAAAGGHRVCLEWAWANGCPVELSALGDAASRSGDIGVLKFAGAHGCEWSPAAAKLAAVRRLPLRRHSEIITLVQMLLVRSAIGVADEDQRPGEVRCCVLPMAGRRACRGAGLAAGRGLPDAPRGLRGGGARRAARGAAGGPPPRTAACALHELPPPSTAAAPPALASSLTLSCPTRAGAAPLPAGGRRPVSLRVGSGDRRRCCRGRAPRCVQRAAAAAPPPTAVVIGAARH